MNWNFALSSADSAPSSAPILLQGSIKENLRMAAALGYNGLEVHVRENAFLNYEDILNTSQECGVKIAAIITGRLNTQGGVNLIDDRPYIVEAAMQGMRSYIDMASRLQSDLVIGWVKGQIPTGTAPQIYLERLAHNLKIICNEACGKGVKVFLEVINRYEVNIFTTAKETVEFIDHWAISNCYVHLDTFHMGIEETDAISAIRLCGNRLGYFHAADNTRRYPGSGTFHFVEYFEALKEIGFKGYVSVECLPLPDWKTAAQNAIQHLKQCAASL